MEKLNAILVTGAAGFIGSNLVKRLVADGRQVCVLVKPSTNLARIQELLPKITCCRADLLDFDGLKSELCAPPELYSITKLAATLYGQAVARRDNKPIITFRLFTPYGPAVQPGRLIYEVITRALRDQEISLYQPKGA